MNKSFLQTEEWLEFQKSIGRKAWRFDDGKVVANIIRHDLSLKLFGINLFGMNYLYIPHGPEIFLDKISGGLRNELEHFVSYVKNLAREQKSIFIKIEPLQDSTIELLYGAGFKKSSKEIQPNRSVIMDLEKSEDELLSGMHHKTRYNIKVAEKNNLVFTVGNDIDAFWKLLYQTAKKDNFSTHSKGYYEKLCSISNLKAEMVFIKHEGVPIAGALLLAYDDTVYYLHGAMDRDSRYKPMMAPYALHWEVMKWAKGYGVKHYDLWGIDAQKWPGVTRFKLGWLGSPTRATQEASARREHGEGGAGRQVEYPGAFDMPIRKLWFIVYKIVRKIF